MATSEVAVEFLVQPFVEGAPGDHVDAAISAFSSRNLHVELGPFASVATGALEPVGEAIAAMIIDSISAGATNLTLQVASDAAQLAPATLHGALEEMMRAAAREIGTDSADWSRADKQQVVRMLDERGAFLLRGAVDDVSSAMGVSRITIYNYLNAIGSNSAKEQP